MYTYTHYNCDGIHLNASDFSIEFFICFSAHVENILQCGLRTKTPTYTRRQKQKQSISRCKNVNIRLHVSPIQMPSRMSLDCTRTLHRVYTMGLTPIRDDMMALDNQAIDKT